MSNTHQPDTGKSPADRKQQDRKQQDQKQQDRKQRHGQDDDTATKTAQGMMPGRQGHLDQQDQKGTGGKPRAANPAADRGDGNNPKRPGDDEDNGEPGNEPAVKQDNNGGKTKKK